MSKIVNLSGQGESGVGNQSKLELLKNTISWLKIIQLKCIY